MTDVKVPERLSTGAVERPPVEGPCTIPSQAAEAVLRGLPQWFGIESALVGYARDAEVLPTFVVRGGATVIAFVSVREHNDVTAEVSCIAVTPGRHGSGIGSALLTRVERWWFARGGRLLQVKTLGARHPSAAYARTRRFYARHGFLAVEEIDGLWPGIPCLLLVKPLAGAFASGAVGDTR